MLYPYINSNHANYNLIDPVIENFTDTNLVLEIPVNLKKGLNYNYISQSNQLQPSDILNNMGVSNQQKPLYNANGEITNPSCNNQQTSGVPYQSQMGQHTQPQNLTPTPTGPYTQTHNLTPAPTGPYTQTHNLTYHLSTFGWAHFPFPLVKVWYPCQQGGII